QTHANIVCIHYYHPANLMTQSFVRQGVKNLYDDSINYGQLSLSLVKSRLFLDCLTEADNHATFTCVGEAEPTPNGEYAKRVIAQTQINIIGSMVLLDKEAEVYGDNAIEFGGKGLSAAAILAQEYGSPSCLTKKPFSGKCAGTVFSHICNAN